MLLGELLTLRQQHLPVKVVVFNNGALGFVELEMKAAGIATYATELDNPDFAGIAKSAGLFGATVDKADELEDALGAAFGHDGPALVDVRTARQELALPPKLTFGQIKGFTLLRDQDDTVRRRRRTRRAHEDEPAPTGGRIT